MPQLLERSNTSANRPKLKRLKLKDIRTEGTQARAETNEDVAHQYAELMKDGVEFPPLIVFRDGKHNYLADGFTRKAAAEECGLTEFDCEVRRGTLRDALRFALKANATHGVPRTNADKRRAVEIAFADDEWKEWSDRAIAELCAVSPTFVGTVRAEIEEGQVQTVDTSGTPRTRLGRDGRRQPVRQRTGAGNSRRAAANDDPQSESADDGTSVNGKSTAPAQDKARALELLSTLSRTLRNLGIFEEFDKSLSAMIRRVKALT